MPSWWPIKWLGSRGKKRGHRRPLELEPTAPTASAQCAQQEPTAPTASPQCAQQELFHGASDFTVSGGQFNMVAGDYVERKTVVIVCSDEESERRLQEFRQKEVSERSLSWRPKYTKQNTVTIIDALGEKCSLHPSILATYEDVHMFMLKHFKGVIGAQRVARQSYCLVLESDGTLVQSGDWENVVKRREVMIMCMIIERAWVEEVKETCPQCGKTELGTYDDGGWGVVCRRCKNRFTHAETPDRAEKYPPYDDNKIASFRYMRKVFVKRDVKECSFQSWDEAEKRETSRYEGVSKKIPCHGSMWVSQTW